MSIKNLFSFLNLQPAGEEETVKRRKPWFWLVLMLIIGLLLMLVSSFIEVKDVPSQDPSPARAQLGEGLSLQEYEKLYEQSLSSILRQVVGVGKVQVFVNVDSVDEVVIEKNRQDTQQVTNEKDRQGAVRQVTEMVRDGEVATVGGGAQQPLIVKKVKPRIRGVLVVAEGVERQSLKKMVIEAVERTLDVPSHRISVLPAKKTS
jgi:stage III sporulation protein AG